MGAAYFGNSAYRIDVDASLHSQNLTARTSTIYWRILVIKDGSTGHMATTNMGNSGWADSNVGGNPDLWSNGNMAYDFRNGSMTGTFTIASGTFTVGHDAAGNASYFVNGSLTLYALGTASAGTGTRSLPSLAKVPAAPTPLSLDWIEMTTMRYRFQGNSNGGAPIIEWQIGFGTHPSTVQHTMSSGGTSVVSGLAPGTTYYFWSRGRNAVGWGPWSARSSATTRAGAYVRVAGVWKPAVPYVRVAGVWKYANPWVNLAGVWKQWTA